MSYTCGYILMTGKNAGLCCAKPIKEPYGVCLLHEKLFKRSKVSYEPQTKQEPPREEKNIINIKEMDEKTN